MKVKKVNSDDGISFHYEVDIDSKIVKITIENIRNPFGHKYALNPTISDKKLKKAIVAAVEEYRAENEEDLNNNGD